MNPEQTIKPEPIPPFPQATGSATAFVFERRDKPICPHCGHGQRDAWEIDCGPGIEGDTEMACGECGRSFSVSRHCTVSWSTRKLPNDQAERRPQRPMSDTQPKRTGQGVPPSAPATGSAACCICKWTNASLLNLGEPGGPRWACHGCCKRMLEALERIMRYPVHSEPVGGAMAMQDIAHETLSPNAQAEPPA